MLPGILMCLDCEALDVIQFTPGDGSAPARTYAEMFKKVQAAGANPA